MQSKAKTVKDYLVNKGVPASQLSTKGFGETWPISVNNTDVGRSQNRRVEIRPAN